MDAKSYVESVYDVLHAIPEKGMIEYKTSAYVLEKLREFGYETIVKHAGSETGILAILDSGVEGPVLGLRADMDALEYSVDGVMEMRHTCGHDAHTSMLLVAAKVIKEKNIVKKGKLVLIFQPGEEVAKGALAMSESGLLDEVTHLVGMHIRPVDDMKLGQASPDMWHSAANIRSYKIEGKSAHGARPHLGVNVVDIGAAIVNAINAIKENPRVPHSIKVTNISVPGTTYNTIPDTLTLGIDMRAQDNDVMDSMMEKVDTILRCSAEMYGGTAEKLTEFYVPAAEYDDSMIAIAQKAIENVLGAEASVGSIVNPGGEDFHFITKKIKCLSTYIALGSDAYPGLHHKDMQLNKECLINGVLLWEDVVQQILG